MYFKVFVSKNGSERPAQDEKEVFRGAQNIERQD